MLDQDYSAYPERPPFGRLLREYRITAKLSQELLAERARISVACVSVLERGVRRAPQRKTFALLASALELSAPDRARLEAAAERSAPRRREVGSPPNMHVVEVDAIASKLVALDDTEDFGRQTVMPAANCLSGMSYPEMITATLGIALHIRDADASTTVAQLLDKRFLSALSSFAQLLGAASVITQQVVDKLGARAVYRDDS